MQTQQKILAQIKRLRSKAETGEQWAEICALEEELHLQENLRPQYSHCDFCDQRPGTHEVMWGGVRCDECRERAEQ